MDNNKKQKIFVLGFILSILIVGLASRYLTSNRIKNNLLVSSVRIEKVDRFDKFAKQRVWFITDHNDTLYHLRDDINYAALVQLAGKIIPIAYDSSDHRRNWLLITVSDYQKFGITYPDSMKWVKDLLGE